jgi:hypothetical protein
MSSITDSILGPDSNSPSLEMPELEEMISLPDSITPGDDSYFSGSWWLVILFLGFIGFITYIYLGKDNSSSITDALSTFKNKITNLFSGSDSSDLLSDTSYSSEEKDVDESTTKQPAPSISKSKNTSQDVKNAFPQGDVAQANALNKAINTSTGQKQQINGEDYEADDSSSNIQKGTSKSGFCYIGEDRGFRTCQEVGVNDTCMSGDIFPTRDVCVNPTLRA